MLTFAVISSLHSALQFYFFPLLMSRENFTLFDGFSFHFPKRRARKAPDPDRFRRLRAHLSPRCLSRKLRRSPHRSSRKPRRQQSEASSLISHTFLFLSIIMSYHLSYFCLNISRYAHTPVFVGNTHFLAF